MMVFVANFTDAQINENRVKTVVAKYLANQKTTRIIRISVVFLSPVRMRKLNEQYRGKNYTPDVLTFPDPLNEILICPQQAQKNEHSTDALVQHGLNHLIGKHH